MPNITNDVVQNYITGFYRAVNDEMRDFRKEAENDRIPIILKDTEMFLNGILALSKPHTILEIGTAVGYSACYFALRTGARVVTIERETEMYERATSNVSKYGLESKIELLIGDAVPEMEKLAERNEKFDFIFIDAGKSHYSEFLEKARPLSNDGTIIVCDNLLMKGKTASDEFDPAGKYKTNIRKMRAFVEEIESAQDLDTTIMAVGDGISVSIVKK